MGKKLTTEDFIKRSKQAQKQNYDYSKSVYTGSLDPIEIICPVHGSFKQMAFSHMKGLGCFKCSCEKRRKGTTKFIEEARVVHGDLYNYDKVLYKNANEEVEIWCKVHQRYFPQKPSVHLHGSHCPDCGFIQQGNTARYTTSEFIKKAKIKHHNFYSYPKTIYNRSGDSVEILCPDHGSFWQIAGEHLQGHGCSDCKKVKVRKALLGNLEDFIVKANRTHKFKFDYSLSNYLGAKEEIEVLCKIHGSFWVTPNNHNNGSGCPKCNSSKGEEVIRLTLEKLKIKFIEQSSLERKDQRSLFFDFYLPDYDLYIEYQGRQHYESVKLWGGIDGFRKRQTNDQYKRDWCKKNSHKLLEIPYWDFDGIKRILKSKLLTFNLN